MFQPTNENLQFKDEIIQSIGADTSKLQSAKKKKKQKNNHKTNTLDPKGLPNTCNNEIISLKNLENQQNFHILNKTHNNAGNNDRIGEVDNSGDQNNSSSYSYSNLNYFTLQKIAADIKMESNHVEVIFAPGDNNTLNNKEFYPFYDNKLENKQLTDRGISPETYRNPSSLVKLSKL